MKDSKKQRHIRQLTLALDVVRTEYESENARVGVFEGRTGVLITLAGALLVFIGHSYQLPKQNGFYALILVLQALSALGLFTSIFSLIKVITVRTFHRVDYPRLYTTELLSYSSRDALSETIGLFDAAIEETSKAIKSREKWFRTGLWLLFACLVLVTVTQLVTLYAGG